ncbi:hypothetical protein P355_1391 [Burkholderia cenocepacia KC-01]|nr:hypothetical protein P355_1391 [Burkholderia cenocepacia KC-01]
MTGRLRPGVVSSLPFIRRRSTPFHARCPLRASRFFLRAGIVRAMHIAPASRREAALDRRLRRSGDNTGLTRPGGRSERQAKKSATETVALKKF